MDIATTDLLQVLHKVMVVMGHHQVTMDLLKTITDLHKVIMDLLKATVVMVSS